MCLGVVREGVTLGWGVSVVHRPGDPRMGVCTGRRRRVVVGLLMTRHMVVVVVG